MNSIIIDNKPWTAIRFGLGVLLLIAGLAYFLGEAGDLRFINYFLLFAFTLAGITNMTNDFGTSRTFFKKDDGNLTIRLMGWLHEKILPDNQVDNISLQKNRIVINLKTGKPVRIRMDIYETHQKRMIYEFIISFSKERNIRINEFNAEDNKVIASGKVESPA